MLLNTKHRVLAWTEISRGGLSVTIVEPREVFPSAILGNVASIDPRAQPPKRRSHAEPGRKALAPMRRWTVYRTMAVIADRHRDCR